MLLKVLYFNSLELFICKFVNSVNILLSVCVIDDNREGARIWRQLCFLIESLSVSYAILREPLSAEQYASKRAKVSRLLTKLFSYLLHCFKVYTTVFKKQKILVQAIC